jgi:HSP20 family protein
MYFRTYLPTLVAKEINRALATGNCDSAECTQFSGHHLRSEIRDHKDGWEILLETPGMAKEDLEIALDKEELVIRGSLSAKTLDEGERVLHSNRLYGRFERRFRLSDDVRRDNIQASIQNGVLSIRLGKAEKALPTRIEIQG